MITATGYSKNPNIQPDGIVITFGREMMKDNGGAKLFLRAFQETMANEEGLWMHKMSNRPTYDFVDVYIICMNRLYGRVKAIGFETGERECHRANDTCDIIDWQRLLLVGPFEPCPFKRELRGFQGFRKCTKLF